MNFLRLNEVKNRTGLSTSTIWRLEKTNNFPKRKRISKRCVAWTAEAVDSWIKEKYSGLVEEMGGERNDKK